jgi:HD-GYP domain-containing protein (c-di-GMP phosphodiesterase class II)
MGRLQDFLDQRELGGFVLTGSPGIAEVDALVATLLGLTGWETGSAPATVDEVNQMLSERGAHHIRVIGPGGLAETDRGRDDRALAALRLYLRGVRAVERLHERGAQASTVRELGRVSQGVVELVEEDWRRAMVLVVPRNTLPYHLRHPVHTAILSVALGVRLGVEGPQLLDLALCAFAADSGMAGIPAEIREKATPLIDRERLVLCTHPLESVRNLLHAPRLTPGVMRRLLVAFEHHIGVDGRGYPRALRWPGQHLYSRVVAIADAFDAIRADRPHRPGLAPQAAIDSLRREAGKRFDADLLDHFEALIRPELGLSLPSAQDITDVVDV